MRALARDTIERFQIQADAPDLAAALSGGTQQKLMVAKALADRVGVLVAVNPTRGLDLGATVFIREQLRVAAQEGAAILLISTDLEEVLELGSRIGVLFRGRLLDVAPGENTRARLGELMLGRS